ncbi:MAG: hypothetical protein PHY09_02665 [Desulfuromonadaceae bacterium]|nr:hypothetical protein [Desulfuromonadaceae bacterium]MDD5105498.1 hypothetical protein [Desulfuromonadaceae bacterium]
MFGDNNDLGASLFKTWTEKQRSDEIGKLVAGYRGGVPVGILCKMSETIAGNKKKAKKYLAKFMSEEERKSAIATATDSMAPVVKSFLA